MPQKASKIDENKDQQSNGEQSDIADDVSTLAPSRVSYSRSQGSFIVDDEEDGPLYDGRDDSSTLLSGNVHTLNHGKSSLPFHKRSSSNELLLSAQLSQMNYNNNRVSLGRAILQLQDLLQQIDLENEARPIHLPHHGEERSQLHVLKLHVKIDGNYSERSDFNLDKEALAKLFKSQIDVALNHLKSLQKRVDDVSSKVFITGDVNTGKSSFCNSLLRRKLLPEDQLPCTNVFCEILEARENGNNEEVHALSTKMARTVKDANTIYKIRDKSTYETHSLKSLPELVQKNEEYILLKIYIKDDKRTPETSLLRNGTVDISLIDSPGLNMDCIQTSEVMARQEEIDLVIFVVNAENQLTLSAKEFIALASREKKFMFFVVKKFDKIRDKQRCKDLILKQIKDLSPETHKSSSQFIHFLSDNGDGSDPDPHDNPDDDDKYDRDDPNPDFDHLENSLRNFVLKKRSLSKLLPAKTYICKLLSDVQMISQANMKIYQQEDNALNKNLEELRPEFAKVKAHCDGLSETVDKLSEETVSETYEYTRQKIQYSLQIPLSEFPQYQGISQIHEFIFQTEQFIKDQIKESIFTSEFFAKGQTAKCVNEINSLGKEKLGDDFMSNRVFKSNLMFTKKRHFFIKKLSVPLSATDFFAPSWEGLFGYLSWGFVLPTHAKPSHDSTNSSAVNSNSFTGVLGLGRYSSTQYWTKPSLLFTSRIPTLALYSFGGVKVIKNIVLQGFQFFSWQTIKRISGSLLLVGSLLSIAYLVHDLPRALPQNLSAKYRKTLQENDYAHMNSERISREVREVLRIPTREIVKACELVMDKKQTVKRDLQKKLENNALSVSFFHQLLERATSQRELVERINLDVD